MSSGGCKCGSSCSCGSNCSCEAYPDVEIKPTIIEGVAPVKIEGSEESFGVEGANTCKCGSSCTCSPCTC